MIGNPLLPFSRCDGLALLLIGRVSGNNATFDFQFSTTVARQVLIVTFHLHGLHAVPFLLVGYFIPECEAGFIQVVPCLIFLLNQRLQLCGCSRYPLPVGLNRAIIVNHRIHIAHEIHFKLRLR